MSILFAAAGSLAGFTASALGNTVTTTTAAHFDSAYVQAAIGIHSQSTLTTTPLATPITEGWMHFEWYHDAAISSTIDQSMWVIQSGSTPLFRLSITNNNFTVLQYYNGSSWQTLQTISSQSLNYDEKYKWDIYLNMHDTTGVLQVYLNDVLLFDYSGDTIRTTPTDFDRLVLQSVSPLGAGATCYFSQVIIADEDTRNLKVFASTLTGAGTTNDFTSGVYTDVDEEGKSDDTDKLSSGTANQIFLAATENMPAGRVPKAVAINARALQVTFGPTKINLAIRSGGTNYYSSDLALGSVLGPVANVWNTDPATAAPWTESGFNAIEAGVRSRT